jgi:hypothetical protein
MSKAYIIATIIITLTFSQSTNAYSKYCNMSSNPGYEYYDGPVCAYFQNEEYPL